MINCLVEQSVVLTRKIAEALLRDNIADLIEKDLLQDPLADFKPTLLNEFEIIRLNKKIVQKLSAFFEKCYELYERLRRERLQKIFELIYTTELLKIFEKTRFNLSKANNESQKVLNKHFGKKGIIMDPGNNLNPEQSARNSPALKSPSSRINRSPGGKKNKIEDPEDNSEIPQHRRLALVREKALGILEKRVYSTHRKKILFDYEQLKAKNQRKLLNEKKVFKNEKETLFLRGELHSQKEKEELEVLKRLLRPAKKKKNKTKVQKQPSKNPNKKSLEGSPQTNEKGSNKEEAKNTPQKKEYSIENSEIIDFSDREKRNTKRKLDYMVGYLTQPKNTIF